MKKPAKNQSKKIVAIYARTSGYSQMHNFSIQGQVNACLKHCEEQDWQVKYVFVDEAKTGENTQRPKFQLMLDKAKAQEFNIILTWKLDRLCRSVADLICTERELRRQNVGIYSLTERIDTVSALGRFNFRSLASFSELERELISERTKMGLSELIRLHKWPTGTPPVGFYRSKKGDLHPNTTEVKVVNTIFRIYTKSKSLPETAFLLDKEGIKTKKIKKWTARAVHDIITNELYVGKFRVAGFSEYVSKFKIVDLNLSRKANRIRIRYKKGNGKRPPMPTDRKAAKVEKVFSRYVELLEPVKSTATTPLNH